MNKEKPTPESRRVMEHRRKLKRLGWRQLSLMVPSDVVAEKIMNYKWLLMRGQNGNRF